MTVSEARHGEPQAKQAGASVGLPKLRYTLLTPARDACVAFALFVLVSLALSSGPSSASPNHLLGPGPSFTLLANPAVATPGDQRIFNVAAKTSAIADGGASRQTDTAASWLLLSLAFSLLAALNMALVRHLRVAYANPRKNAKN